MIHLCCLLLYYTFAGLSTKLFFGSELFIRIRQIPVTWKIYLFLFQGRKLPLKEKKIIFNICKISICFFSKCQVGYGIKSRIRPVPNPHYRFSEPCYVVCTAPQAVGLRPSPPNPRRVQKTGRKSRGESVLSQAEATKSGQPSQGTPRQEKGCGEEAGPQQERPHR